MTTRRNGRRGFLTNGGNSPNNYKGNRFNHSGYTAHHHHNSHHNGHGPIQQQQHTPSPAAISWYNSINNNNNNHSTSVDMFSSSPPNNYSSMYNLAKFSPPKYGYGMASKWSSPPAHPSLYGNNNGFQSPAKGDKYHWFSPSNKPTIKA